MARSGAIREAVRLTGKTLKQISEAAGLNANACSAALTTAWARAEGVLAAALDLRPDELFPERYVDGRPLRGNAEWPKARRAAARRSA